MTRHSMTRCSPAARCSGPGSSPERMLHVSFMSRPNIIVVPGKMELAMQLIFTPLILRLMEARRRA